MNKEIERKFLVDLDAIGELTQGSQIIQAYIPTTDKTVVRVRIRGDLAYLTLKGENKGLVRSEFEYEIPLDDAKGIMGELCRGPMVSKTRFLIHYADHTWEVDVFDGDNMGLVVAEVELHHEHESVEIPAWATVEVSGDPKYYNSSLLNRPYCTW